MIINTRHVTSLMLTLWPLWPLYIMAWFRLPYWWWWWWWYDIHVYSKINVWMICFHSFIQSYISDHHHHCQCHRVNGHKTTSTNRTMKKKPSEIATFFLSLSFRLLTLLPRCEIYVYTRLSLWRYHVKILVG